MNLSIMYLLSLLRKGLEISKVNRKGKIEWVYLKEL